MAPSPTHASGGPETPPATKDDNPFAALFDFGFRRYATPGFVKVIFGLFFVLAALTSLAIVIRFVAWLISGQDGGLGLPGELLLLAGGLLVPFLVLMLIRVLLEFSIAMVRVARNTAELRDDLEQLRQQLASDRR